MDELIGNAKIAANRYFWWAFKYPGASAKVFFLLICGLAGGWFAIRSATTRESTVQHSQRELTIGEFLAFSTDEQIEWCMEFAQSIPGMENEGARMPEIVATQFYAFLTVHGHKTPNEAVRPRLKSIWKRYTDQRLRDEMERGGERL